MLSAEGELSECKGQVKTVSGEILCRSVMQEEFS